MRLGTVPALSDDLDDRLVDRGHRRAGNKAELPRRDIRPIVQAEDGIDRKAIEKPFRQHLACTRANLLGWLEYQPQGATEIAAFGEITGGSQQDRCMSVVTAGMHDAGIGTLILETGRLLDRQGIHVGADSDTAVAIAPPQGRDHAGTGDTCCDVVAPFHKQRGHLLGGAMLLKGEFGILMQIMPERDDLIEIGGDPCLDLICD